MKKFLSISDAASLAIHTLALMATRPQAIFSNHLLAETLQASPHHLSKVLQRLSRAGYVDSVRGPKGGFRMVPDWEGISLLDIYEAMEGRWNPATCLLGRTVCLNGRRCPLSHLLRGMSRQVQETLRRNTLSDLVKYFTVRKKAFSKKEGTP